MRRQVVALVAIGVLLAAVFFGLGLVASRMLAPAQAPVTSASAPPSSPPPVKPTPIDAGADAKEPTIIFDPSTISLLPDASLRLDLPPSFDAGAKP